MDAHGIEIRVVGIANSKHFITNASGINLDNYLEELTSSNSRPFSIADAKSLIEDSHPC